MIRVLALFLALVVPAAAFAGPKEVKSAAAICYVIVVHERCTESNLSTPKLERIVRSMQAKGISEQDFRNGSTQAIAQIDKLYPGSARPSQSTCNEAEKLYRDVLGPL